MLTSWLMQAGFNPPAISIAVGDWPTFSFSGWRAGDFRFVINVLSENQRSLLGKFGKPPARDDEPFSGLDIRRDLRVELEFFGILLAGWSAGQGRPFYQPATEQSSGDHAIVVADVLAAER